MTNAMVEISMISVTIVLGIIGLPVWAIGMMVGVSLCWWIFVHHARFGAILKTGFLGAIGSLLLAILAMGVGHGIGYGFGRALHAIMGFK